MKILKVLGLIGLPFVLLIGIFFILLAWFPQKIINIRNLKIVQEHFFSDVKLDLDKLDLNVESPELFKKILQLEAKDFCLKQSMNEFCFEELSAKVELDLSFSPNIAIRSLFARDKKILFSSSKNGEEKLDLKKAFVDFNNFFHEAKELLQGEIDLLLDDFKSDEGESLEELRVAIKGKKVEIASKEYSLNLSLKESDLNGTFRYSSQDILTKMNVHLGFMDENIVIDLKNVEVFYKKDKFYSGNCGAHLDLDRSSHLVFECPDGKSSLDLNKRIELSKGRELSLSKLLLKSSLSLKVPLAKIPDSEQKILEVKISASSTKTKIFNFETKVSASLIQENSKLRIRPDKIFWSLKVLSFQKLEKSLRAGSLAIPAPFNTLEGSLELYSEKLYDRDDRSYEIPLQVKLNLDKNKFNKLSLESQGILSFDSKLNKITKVSQEVVVNKLHLYLPRIDPILGLPPVTQDKRIKKEKLPERANREVIDYSLNVKTSSRDSIRIYYYLIEPYLNVVINIHGDNEELEGEITTSNDAKLKYLRREITLDQLSYKIKSQEINGRFVYKISGYDVFIEIMGKADKPVLSFSSEPSLSRSDLISLILYGKKSNYISSFQKESVGGTEAAINDKALGLFSIWAFSSTPIESVQYNSATKQYSAQVSIPGGVNVSIGTDWEKVSSLTFQKRLTPTLSIFSTYRPENEGDEAGGDVMLQKEFHFD